MNIVISHYSGVPIYEQIKEQVIHAVFTGELKDGDQLPSIRGLAKDLKISVITTTRAYGDLEREGFVVNVQGKGCFVKPQDPGLLRRRKLRGVEDHLRNAIGAARLCGLPARELADMLARLMNEEDEHE